MKEEKQDERKQHRQLTSNVTLWRIRIAIL